MLINDKSSLKIEDLSKNSRKRSTEQVQTILTSNRRWKLWSNKEFENWKTKRSLIKSKWRNFWRLWETKRQKQLSNSKKETNFRSESEKRNSFWMIKRIHISTRELKWLKRRIKLRSSRLNSKDLPKNKKLLTRIKTLLKSQLINSKPRISNLRSKSWSLSKRLKSTLSLKK